MNNLKTFGVICFYSIKEYRRVAKFGKEYKIMNEMQKGTEKSINHPQMSKELCFPPTSAPLNPPPISFAN